MSVSLSYNIATNLQLPRTIPAGLPKEVQGTFEEIYRVLNNLALALTNDAGVGQRNPLQWDALAGLSQTILANNISRFYAVAAENLAFGDIVTVFDSGAGIPQVRKANATDNTKPARGFCNAVSGILAGSAGEVILSVGLLPAAGLTVGSNYYLSLASGIMTAVAPVAVGNIEQYLGFAVTPTALYFNCAYWIQH